MHPLAALALAALLPGFTTVPGEPHGGTVLGGRFPGTPRPGFVYLPPSFDPARRYPVVYLLHGLPGSPSEYVRGTSLVGFADTGIRAGRLRPFIAVVPAAGLTPAYGGEWAGVWERELVEEVIPWTDAHLPTVAAPAGRVIAGLSAGGFGAIDIALHHPLLFGAAESWSGYFTPLRDDPFRHASAARLAANDPVRLARAEARRLRAARLRFFVSTGPSHSRLIAPGATPAFARELRSLGLPVAFRRFPRRLGEWSAQVGAGIAWAFAA